MLQLLWHNVMADHIIGNRHPLFAGRLPSDHLITLLGSRSVALHQAYVLQGDRHVDDAAV
ncbi:hypothetical protein KWH01_20690 [Xanthomonas campestris pv. merremiae]|uniref:hypothetical protein n=1 Tax=Xanthomonas citri TaxID=346 RepID=UPI0012FE139B|nr:hypothetical protein [Xanthomonas citri]MBV6839588.1 hypothetical protein [Xanthomonas campestris pv. merremiae]MCC8567276.1 hypothetical protein [Xanthomonas citri pv. fuscans]